MEMLETRTAVIERRVFKLSDLRSLAECVEKAAEQAPIEGEEPYSRVFDFSAACFDGSSYQTLDTAIFSDTSPLVRKRVRAVTMEFDDSKSHASIRVSLWHGREKGDIRVRGRNSNWVNGTMKTIEEIVDGAAPQEPFVFRHPVVAHILLSFGLGALSLWVARAVSQLAPPPPTFEWYLPLIQYLHAHPILHLVAFVLVSSMLSLPLAHIILEGAKRLWPSIELQVGSDHVQLERRRRAVLVSIWTLAVLPLLVTAFAEIAKLAL